MVNINEQNQKNHWVKENRWEFEKITSEFDLTVLVITEKGMKNFVLNDEIPGVGQLPVVFTHMEDANNYAKYRGIEDYELHYATVEDFQSKEAYLVTEGILENVN